MQWILEHQSLILSSLCAAAVSGAAVGWWVKQRFITQTQLLEQQLSAEKQLHQQQLEQVGQRLAEAQQELDELDDERDKAAFEVRQSHGKLMAAMEKLRYFEAVKQERQQYFDELGKMREQKSRLETQLREQQARHEQVNQSNAEKLQILEQAEVRLKQQFEHLANQLFEEKTAKVDLQNRQSLEGLLSPLREQLDGFKKQVNDSFSQEAKERHTLVHELKNLQRLNEQMTREAVNLTQALKGDNKQQGNWGEVVLARVLAESGLREGHEYETQVNLQNEAGKRYQPDVIVHLPQNKQVVVDSKMALVAYERYFNAETDAQRDQALNAHLIALRAHIKGLSMKDYHKLKGIQSLDYVLMFIPVEPAFQVAIQADPSLVKDAMEQNIILVSPTTLLVALRTIDNLWRNERQNENAKLIAERATKLYDKLRLFIDDMEGLGGALDKANQTYQGAMNKLATGRGNVIRQAESFKQLGVEIKRPISSDLAQLAQSEAFSENESLVERHPAEDKVN
ncbi:DNA recombination protein RmuC [Vibrio natriegens]|jgi:DNA recombination protein RmuC|uniref:Recombinase RmuC n=1 Tax=Vibrio natriegens NBRC 15636 = ATCC 14048 = DSM 759 TaxID=1219067 RepID=A0AAN0Y0G4_VIBNA|nr:DNA recombination protein RmuC [Vibrio natriegens]ALR16821.1 DNA recombination protein RmuC [Vibrio natriegens NBRC 15636 = ATCC 14048 = DSM 759]ANQ11313.1 recombinase RmuC [Vibrio natriegens NBRC 15636 = ATCC 14048 = DSM 759]EPM38520.1 DNA recombination protein RmuC [Vibrio natriegens NBRC 15636 = ATCC 14048 = DSM 759]MDX6025636.1 DNA recombination protein RmuC [Vibrio natriegens NBRC 15636 = ATCC 14048 = DSM 759]UUI11757.1 DNA recombination protein RmuC [Vibrio natriegens]